MCSVHRKRLHIAREGDEPSARPLGGLGGQPGGAGVEVRAGDDERMTALVLVGIRRQRWP